MDHRIEWSPEATEDVEAIAGFISRDSVFYARAVVSKILSVSRTLADFPHIGRVVPELGNENIRERFVYSYRLVYCIEEKRILVVAVVHGKRLLESIASRFTDANV
ncbi:MAG: type II toxin-antitoxin system RelE/ParE family toxin [Gammaproteobacteria bacterium]